MTAKNDMHLDPITYQPIGIIRSGFSSLEGMPIQPCGAAGQAGRLELLPEYADGLLDLDGFSHIIILYHFHAGKGPLLRVTPFLDDQEHGIFATRAPRRPNPIGLSVVQLTKVDSSVVYIEGVDVLDGTPLLDIKPYFPGCDRQDAVRIGWLEKRHDQASQTRADQRFT